MGGLIEFWSHALAAVMFGTLAVWQLRHWGLDARNRWLAAAFAVTSLWGIFTAILGSHSMAATLAESARNFAFLGFMYAIVRSAAAVERQRAVRVVYSVVAGVIGFQLTIAGVMPEFAEVPLAFAALTATAQMLGLTIAAGSLVLVHNLYGQAAPDARWGIKLPMLALAGMWAYDLHLYTVGYLSRAPVEDLLAIRGGIVAMTAPLFALAARRSANWRMQISRAATFQSFSVLAILGYLIVMMSATRALEIVGGDWVRVGQVGVIFATTVAAVLVIPSGRMRAWMRVVVAKHFFEHRYDYRQEWLRFTRAVAVAGEDARPIAQRVVKAIADIADSPAGLLLVADDAGRLSIEARLNWHCELPHGSIAAAEFVRFLERSAHVVDFDSRTGPAAALPTALATLEGAWAGVPLLHKDRLVGLVILEHPMVRRPLDWEDYDLFRTAGIQAASYLAEARSREALADAQRFDEFNRRFAFIMHDIKNLVSQLSLVARNAERHAHNPAFREDMIATLQSSVKKMNDLLARLSRGRNGEAERPRPTGLGALVATVAEGKRRAHPILVEAEPALVAQADPASLEQALAHLVQNAIDASGPNDRVVIRACSRGREAAVEIVDQGTGMSPEFIRSRLFQPFASTKEGGFGVGAFEARALLTAMGGRLEVTSREGEGTCFTVFLPRAATSETNSSERMCA
jgi:putative PEP-CTERM system histidine kinase